MGVTKREEGGNIYLSIIKGTFMQTVKEDTPEAVKRTYEDSEGNEKTKFELQYSKVDGMLDSVEFSVGDFGEQCILNLSDVDEKIKIYLSTDSRFFTDFAKKLPNIDLSKKVELSAYDFEGKGGKQVRGLGVVQDGEKLYSYYWDADKKETVNGLPQPDGNTKDFDSDDWKMFFLQEKKFLKKKVQAVKFSGVSTPADEPKAAAPKAARKPAVEKEEDDDLPF